MQSEAKVVIIGGGVVGCSILYHLAKFGWKDVILLERNELTSGSSWHAAGQIHTLSSDPNISRLQGYTINLYKEIEEISGQSVEPFLAASSIVGILAQRLVRKICLNCRQEYLPDQRVLDEAGFGKLPAGTKLYRGTGCELCHGSGYRGRLGIFELLTMSDAVRSGLMASNGAISVRQVAIDEGMLPLRQFGLQRVLKGETTVEEVLRVTQEEG